MTLDGDMRHLTSEQIQEHLDESLPPEEEAIVREHLAVCHHCQSELEAWTLLFSELRSLPEITPGAAFSAKVMAQVELPRPLWDRIRGRLGGFLPTRGTAGNHLPQEAIQDYVDGLLPVGRAARAGAHLEDCDRCREELTGWERLFGALGALQRFAPSPGFAERVMARVRVPAPVPARRSALVLGRALDLARKVLPRTRRGWAVAGGVASTPTITMAALVYLVFSKSILTVGSLATYASWKLSALTASLFAMVKNGVLESVVLFRIYSFLEAAAASPLLLGAGGLVFSILSAGALWVLYRNLIVTHSDARYAHARS